MLVEAELPTSSYTNCQSERLSGARLSVAYTIFGSCRPRPLQSLIHRYRRPDKYSLDLVSLCIKSSSRTSQVTQPTMLMYILSPIQRSHMNSSQRGEATTNRRGSYETNRKPESGASAMRVLPTHQDEGMKGA